MKSILTISILMLFSLSFAPQQSQVYICKGSMSERYHLTPNCRGLKKCSTKIYSVSLQEARSIGRTKCGYEK